MTPLLDGVGLRMDPTVANGPSKMDLTVANGPSKMDLALTGAKESVDKPGRLDLSTLSQSSRQARQSSPSPLANQLPYSSCIWPIHSVWRSSSLIES